MAIGEKCDQVTAAGLLGTMCGPTYSVNIKALQGLLTLIDTSQQLFTLKERVFMILLKNF